MRLTFDPVVSLHRPLLWYIVSMMTSFLTFHHLLTCSPSVSGVDFYSSLSIRTRGFQHYTTRAWFPASHLVPRHFCQRNPLTPVYRIGTAPIVRQLNHPFYSSTALGYDFSSSFFLLSFSHTSHRSAYGPTSSSSQSWSTKTPTSASYSSSSSQSACT